MLTKNNYLYVFFLIVFLIISINILCYDNSALGRVDNDGDSDRKDKNEMKNYDDGNKDDPPFILPLPFP